MDLSKSFDHSVLLIKLWIPGVNTRNLAWFVNDLDGKKNYIKITNYADAMKQDIKCGVPQGSIRGSLIIFITSKQSP